MTDVPYAFLQTSFRRGHAGFRPRTWRMGESGRRRADELDALKYGLELGYP